MLRASMLAVFVLSANPSVQAPDLDTDYGAIAAANVNPIVDSVVNCASHKIKEHVPPADQIGSTMRAMLFLAQSLQACGLQGAIDRVRHALRQATPDVRQEDLDRQTKVAFGVPVALSYGELAKKFALPIPESPPTPVLTVPCPPEDQPQPNACRSE